LKVKKKPAKKKEKVSSQGVPPVEILLDASEYCPDKDGWVVANVPITIAGTRQIALSHRNSALVDCGFEVKVPVGFKLVVELAPNFKDRGLELFNNTLVGSSRVNFSVRNLGREIIVINHRDRVGFLRIEPVYPLTFKTMESAWKE
jgi:dUTPase